MKFKPFYIGLFTVILIHLFPFLILGENAYIVIMDNLDTVMVYYSLLKDSNLLFTTDFDALVPQVMNGIPRNYFHSEFNVIRILYLIFPVFWAYVINNVFIHIIGFCGMYLYIDDYHKKLSENETYKIAISLIFATIPTYSTFGLILLGIPFLMWAFSNLSMKRNLYFSYLVIIVFPFYSHIALIGPFIVFFFFSYAIIRYYNREKIEIQYFYGLLLLVFCFLLSNLNILYGFFLDDMDSIRENFKTTTLISSGSLLKRFIYYMFFGHYHYGTSCFLPIVFIVIYSLFKTKNLEFTRNVLGLVGLIIFSALLSASYEIFRFYLGEKIPLINKFNFARLYSLVPILWFILLIMALNTFKFKRKIISFLLIIQFITFTIFSVKNVELLLNYSKILFPKLKMEKVILEGLTDIGIDSESLNNYVGRTYKFISYNNYLAPNLFNHIKDHIGLPTKDYRVISLGMHPSVSILNGFYTLDFNINNYPLKYKEKFRNIISDELEKNEHMKIDYDSRGRCPHLYSEELWNSCDLLCGKENNRKSVSLSINTQALKELGGNYILSALLIENPSLLGLSLEQKFQSSDSFWNVYLYKLK